MTIFQEWFSFGLTIIFGMVLGASLMYYVMKKNNLETEDITEFLFESEDEELSC